MMMGARLLQRPGAFAAVLLLALVGAHWSAPAQAEEPSAPPPASKGAAGTAKKKEAARPAGTAARAASADGASTGGASSGATETIALEIVAKAPKPIPPVELDMLQLRLMLTDLKASFADEIDKALFRDPF